MRSCCLLYSERSGWASWLDISRQVRYTSRGPIHYWEWYALTLPTIDHASFLPGGRRMSLSGPLARPGVNVFELVLCPRPTALGNRADAEHSYRPQSTPRASGLSASLSGARQSIEQGCAAPASGQSIRPRAPRTEAYLYRIRDTQPGSWGYEREQARMGRASCRG